MDDQGRLFIPGELRKDGTSFIGETFKQTGVDKEVSASELDAKIRAIRDKEAELADMEAFARRQKETAK